jgi:hypothetical protein
VRSGKWKVHFVKTLQRKNGANKDLVACSPPELYNLDTDPGEKQNVHSDHPEIVASLIKQSRDFEMSFVPGRRPPPQWRSVLPRIRGLKKKRK